MKVELMPEKNSERIKVYIVLGLTLVLVFVVYTRFSHKKGTGDEDQMLSTVSPSSLEVPQVELNASQTAPLHRLSVQESARAPARDIFTPPGLSAKAAGQAGQSSQKSHHLGTREAMSRASLKLRGVMRGGDRPVALINDRFVHTGDRINEYKVISIGVKEVLLDSGMQTVRLRILNHE